MDPIITLETPTTNVETKNILSKDGFNCALIKLGPGDEIAREDGSKIDEHILVVIDGEVTVRCGDVNTILSKDEALLVKKGKAHSIAAKAGSWVKLLRVDIPPRQIITPPIISFDS